jgi:hypothetical protein
MQFKVDARHNLVHGLFLDIEIQSTVYAGVTPNPTRKGPKVHVSIAFGGQLIKQDISRANRGFLWSI